MVYISHEVRLTGNCIFLPNVANFSGAQFKIVEVRVISQCFWDVLSLIKLKVFKVFIILCSCLHYLLRR